MGNVDERLKTLLSAVLKKLRISVKESTVDALVQFVKFGVVGLTNTLISYGLNVLVLLVLKPYNLSWDYIAGNVIAFILSVLWSFYWNNKFVFTARDGQKRNLWQALIKTYIAYGFTGIILNNVLSHVWINVLGISKFVAPLINLIISVPLNFIINKLWAFKA
ncbi:MAG: GtrA family protein [Clostridia bacterium]|nr:GtrA family protein [Clostridia bacterium]